MKLLCMLYTCSDQYCDWRKKRPSIDAKIQDVPIPDLSNGRSLSPVSILAPGDAHTFVLSRLYAVNPCSQQKYPPLSNRFHVSFAHRGGETSSSEVVQLNPDSQHAMLYCEGQA